MLFSCDNLRRHVSWSSRCILLVLRRVDSRDTHISKSEITLGIKDQILGFDITMYDIILMQILETEHDAAYKKFNDMFWKSLVFAQLETQVTSRHIVHD